MGPIIGVAEKYTIFGGYGFVGSEVASQLRAGGHEVTQVGRGNWPETGSDLGQVIFTIGMTADFRKRLVETQIIRVHEALTRYRYASFLYLSSARIYAGAAATTEESAIPVRSYEADHVYNISKLAGECLCLAIDNPAVRVARLSNVYGANDVSNLFLTAVMREAVLTGKVTIGQAAESAKDYLHVEDAARALIAIVQRGGKRLINVACGANTSHREIADVLGTRGLTVEFKSGGMEASFPVIDISRLAEILGERLPGPAVRLPQVLDQLIKRQGHRT
jgi:nucleoside-diphosphate-sugar epimerase